MLRNKNGNIIYPKIKINHVNIIVYLIFCLIELIINNNNKKIIAKGMILI
jgi:hypothetical protein